MPFSNPFDYFAGGEIFETVLPDFVAAFTFFTALSYTVLGRRFGQHRAAVAMSASIGMALSVGLAWWEIEKGVSIRDLGPIAAGFAIILLASVMYPAIKQIGGTWAGAGIALGASILVGWALGARLAGGHAHHSDGRNRAVDHRCPRLPIPSAGRLDPCGRRWSGWPTGAA
jgi:hypothetical protein